MNQVIELNESTIEYSHELLTSVVFLRRLTDSAKELLATFSVILPSEKMDSFHSLLTDGCNVSLVFNWQLIDD